MKVTVYKDISLTEDYIDLYCQNETNDISDLVSYINTYDDKRIIGSYDKEKHVLNKADIFYFESVDKKCFAYMKEAVYQVEFTLNELEDLLESQAFVRINKSVIINLYKVLSIKSDRNMRTLATLENSEMQVISRHYKSTFNKALKSLENKVKGGHHENHN